MSGRWVRIWDDTAKRSFEAYISGETPRLYRGTATVTTTAKDKAVLDQHGKPIRSEKPMGFRP